MRVRVRVSARLAPLVRLAQEALELGAPRVSGRSTGRSRVRVGGGWG